MQLEHDIECLGRHTHTHRRRTPSLRVCCSLCLSCSLSLSSLLILLDLPCQHARSYKPPLTCSTVRVCPPPMCSTGYPGDEGGIAALSVVGHGFPGVTICPASLLCATLSHVVGTQLKLRKARSSSVGHQGKCAAQGSRVLLPDRRGKGAQRPTEGAEGNGPPRRSA